MRGMSRPDESVEAEHLAVIGALTDELNGAQGTADEKVAARARAAQAARADGVRLADIARAAGISHPAMKAQIERYADA